MKISQVGAQGPRSAATTYRQTQRGFTLIELIVVFAVIALLAVFAFSRVNGFIVESKAPTVGQELQRAIVKVRNTRTATGAGTAPYTGASTSELANLLRETSFTVTGAGAAMTATHAIGSTGATITMAAATQTVAGDAAAITMNNVNRGACPLLATILDKAVIGITLNGTAIKTTAGGVVGVLNAATASNLCTDGDTNTFVFTFQ